MWLEQDTQDVILIGLKDLIQLSNSQLNKVKSEIKNDTEVTLSFSSNVISNSNDKTNFPHKLLLSNTQVSRLSKTFVNNSSATIKLAKTQLSKIRQSGGFLGRLLGSLRKAGLHLMKNVLKKLAEIVLIPLGLTAAASATDMAIQMKIHKIRTTLIISIKEIDDVMKIVKSLKESSLLIKGDSETIENEPKEQKVGFLSMLLGKLGASLLGNLITGKGVKQSKILGRRADEVVIATIQGRGTIRAW